MTKRRPSFLLISLGIGSLIAIIGATANVTKAEMPNEAGSSMSAPSGTTLGEPLAKSLQGKPVVVDIYASWCPGCKNIAPTLSTLRKQYGDQVHFVVFDVTNKSTTQEAQAKAQQLGLGKFFTANKSQTSTVAVINPSTGQILGQFQNNPELSAYTKIINPAIAQVSK